MVELVIDAIVRARGRETERAGFIGITAVLLLAEGFVVLGYDDLALAVHVFSIPVLLFLVQRSVRPASMLYQALVLVPVLRIFNFGIPPFTDDPLVFLTVIYLFLLASTALIVRSQNLSPETLGLTPRYAKLVPLGILIGLVLGTVQYAFSLETIPYDPSMRNYVLVIVTAGLLVGLVEEIIWRGLIQRWASALFGDWFAIIAVSILFGFMHSVWINPMDIVFAGVVSVFLGWIYLSTDNLWLVTSIHGSINIGLHLVAPRYLL